MSLVLVASSGAGLLGLLTGWLGATATSRFRRASNVEDIALYMESVVNLEDAEAKRKLIHRQLVQSGRRSVRPDGGLPAKVHHMRKRNRRRKNQIR